MSDQPKPSVIESVVVETDSEMIMVVEQAVRATGLSADQSAPAMIFLVGFMGGQANWSVDKIMEYIKPMVAAGRAKAIEMRVQMAKARSAGES
jgi:hypothetical protein